MIPAIRFCQKHLEVPLDKLLQLIKDNPRKVTKGYSDYSVYLTLLEKALEKENSK